MASESDDAGTNWGSETAEGFDGESYEGEFADRLNEALETARAAEDKAAKALRAAERWETECEFLLKRVSKLESAVENLAIIAPRKSQPPG